MLILKFLSLGPSNFDRLQFVDELDFLIEDFLVRVVAVEQLRFLPTDIRNEMEH